MIQSYLELPVWDAVPHTKCQDPVISCGYQGAGPTPLGFSEESALRNNKIKLFLHTLNGTAPKQPQRDIDTLAEGSKEGRKEERKKEGKKQRRKQFSFVVPQRALLRKPKTMFYCTFDVGLDPTGPTGIRGNLMPYQRPDALPVQSAVLKNASRGCLRFRCPRSTHGVG